MIKGDTCLLEIVEAHTLFGKKFDALRTNYIIKTIQNKHTFQASHQINLNKQKYLLFINYFVLLIQFMDQNKDVMI